MTAPRLEEEQAQQGEKRGEVRYILVLSTLAAFAAMAVVLLMFV